MQRRRWSKAWAVVGLLAVVAVVGLAFSGGCKKTEAASAPTAPAAEHAGHTGTAGMGQATAPAAVSPKAGDEYVVCPVAGEKFLKSKAAGSSTYKGNTYYFCCPDCKPKFDKDPDEYVKS